MKQLDPPNPGRLSRIADLERMLDDAIDERDKARAHAVVLREQIRQLEAENQRWRMLWTEHTGSTR